MTMPSSAANNFISQVPTVVESELRAFFSRRSPKIAAIGGPVTDVIGHLESFVLSGGKRIRPLYAWAGYVAAGGLSGVEDNTAMMRAAASLELIQACALIHDDIVDSSDTRRGNPTVHRAVERVHHAAKWSGDSSKFGQSIAILLGDMALAWADDLFQESGLSAAALRRAQEAWREMRTEVVGGQLLDIIVEFSGVESLELSDSVNKFKTAAYTIERPLHLGAAIADGSPELIQALRGYGKDVGVAYQLRDDMLGVFGDPEVTGKPAGDDLAEGKRTVLLNIALQRADVQDPSAAEMLRSLVGKSKKPEDISTMKQIIVDSGAPKVVEKRIFSLTESGLNQLATVSMPADVQDLLRVLALKSTARAR